MKKEKLLQEYEVTLDSLVEKTKFVYSEEFYNLDEIEKQKYHKDKMATEAHLNTLCEILWGNNVKFGSGGLVDMFAIGILSSMFNHGGFGSSPAGVDYLNNQSEEDGKKESESVYIVPETKVAN